MSYRDAAATNSNQKKVNKTTWREDEINAGNRAHEYNHELGTLDGGNERKSSGEDELKKPLKEIRN